ncbi:hypothetical protein [Halodesulfovibrio aestuarii]|uniref:Uncharacterized protein n=1 Tax=Halodesulfovibrio aestuarii TaxID=126333 RepID=A0A8G2CBL7_9BACT|nr:hypothetical protein [Halodesulfovibrio aestuarii]SHJ60136.1 hypothetical protein SAMN05660830_02797 [Halodesulfovibrio aestuarii]
MLRNIGLLTVCIILLAVLDWFGIINFWQPVQVIASFLVNLVQKLLELG